MNSRRFQHTICHTYASSHKNAEQILGDGMGLLLKENKRNHSSLDKEVEYLTNCINQQAQTSAVSNDIEKKLLHKAKRRNLLISPGFRMLFVEDPLRCRTCLRDESKIRINIFCDYKYIYFDVHNSKPECSGIGLEKTTITYLPPQS